jgi:hypothetical protein
MQAQRIQPGRPDQWIVDEGFGAGEQLGEPEGSEQGRQMRHIFLALPLPFVQVETKLDTISK